MSTSNESSNTRGASTSGVASGSGSGSGSGSLGADAHPHGYPSSLKLPSFWLTRPELWFIQVESAFRNRQPAITNDLVRFDCVIAALPNDVLEKVEHVLTAQAPVGGRYAALQNALVESFGKTAAQRQGELIDMTVRGTLGDLKPTDFLMRIRSLSGEEYEAVEKAILLNALPAPVRTILSNSKAANNKRLALEANQVLEQHLISNTRAGAIYEIDEEEEAEINAASAGRPRRESRDFQSQPQQGGQMARRGTVCKNHYRFGLQAYSCRGGDCPMRHEPLARPQRGSSSSSSSYSSSRGPASGNGRAGR